MSVLVCSHCLWLLELAHSLDVIHEVSAVNVLHHKVQPILQQKGYCPVSSAQRGCMSRPQKEQHT